MKNAGKSLGVNTEAWKCQSGDGLKNSLCEYVQFVLSLLQLRTTQINQ